MFPSTLGVKLCGISCVCSKDGIGQDREGLPESVILGPVVSCPVMSWSRTETTKFVLFILVASVGICIISRSTSSVVGPVWAHVPVVAGQPACRRGSWGSVVCQSRSIGGSYSAAWGQLVHSGARGRGGCAARGGDLWWVHITIVYISKVFVSTTVALICTL